MLSHLRNRELNSGQTDSELMNKIIIFDSDHPDAKQNKCFTAEYAIQGPGHQFTVELAAQAAQKGIGIMTSDVFLKEQQKIDSVPFVITDMEAAKTKALLRRGGIPFLCYSFESPLIARGFYSNIKRRAGKYLHNIQFRGTAERLAGTQTHFEPMYFPVADRVPLDPRPWKDQKYLVLINSNKRIFRTDYSNLKESVRSILSEIKLAGMRMTHPWMRSKEIYKDRIEVINFFSRYKTFELYGLGWEKPIKGYPTSYYEAAKKAYKGSVGYQHKLKLMNEFKFNICFENCEFPGYVTEKIFDSFLSGSIPVYYGAPDIKDFVPANTFIDFRRFKSLHELDEYLKSISEAEWLEMLNAARRFLANEDFDKYHLKHFIKSIIEKIEHYTV